MVRRCQQMFHCLPWFLWIVSVGLVGCGPDTVSKPATPLPPEVDVVQCTSRTVRDYREFTGRTSPSNAIEIRARVSGYIIDSPQSRLIQRQVETSSATNRSNAEIAPSVQIREGERVYASATPPNSTSNKSTSESSTGTLLFLIDPAPYELALEKAQNDLESTERLLVQYENDFRRAEELSRNNSVSKAEYDQARAVYNETLSQIKGLKATVARAQLDLSFTRVTSPINGLLGRTLVTKGNLATADSTILTTVVSDDPIYVYFDVDENSLLDYRQRIREGSVTSARDAVIDVQIGLGNEAGFPHVGQIDFVDNTTDPNTGNTTLRAVITNSEGRLSPGLFARVRSPFTAEYQALLVPTIALGTDQQGKYVLVAQDGKAQRRAVETGPVHNDEIVITQGLMGDEQIIVNGLQKARNNSPIRINQRSTVATSDESAAATGDSMATPVTSQSPAGAK